MLLTVDRFQELEWRHARDERLRVHLHLREIRDARLNRPPSPIRRRLGYSIVRLGRRVAGASLRSPALAA